MSHRAKLPPLSTEPLRVTTIDIRRSGRTTLQRLITAGNLMAHQLAESADEVDRQLAEAWERLLDQIREAQ